MTAASYTGTTASPPRGHAFVGMEAITLEPAAGLACTCTVQPGAEVERMHLVQGEPQGAWRLYAPGESFDVGEGERVLLRPRGIGGAGVTFAWSGDRLEVLRNYTGAKGSKAG